MTVIAGLVQEGKVWMGADRAWVRSGGYGSLIAATSKVHVHKLDAGDPTLAPEQVECLLLGGAGSPRVLQIAFHELAFPPRRGKGTEAYLREYLIEPLREVLKTMGASMLDEGRTRTGVNFLIGLAGQLFEMDENLSLVEPLDPFGAIGAAEEVACGALFCTHGKGVPEQTLLLALLASERFNASVRGPFDLYSTAGYERRGVQSVGEL